eukprot:COSAG01_NODE_6442_length_3662_cov_378.992703_2_plen_114_part_00
MNRKLGGRNEWGARGSARGVHGAGKMTQAPVGGALVGPGRLARCVVEAGSRYRTSKGAGALWALQRRGFQPSHHQARRLSARRGVIHVSARGSFCGAHQQGVESAMRHAAAWW